MARSIHTTRETLRRMRCARLPADDIRDAARDLWRKREMKRLVDRERRGPGPEWRPTPADAVPVRVMETGPYLFHAADADDVREVLRRLPSPVIDGLAGVEMRFGAQLQRRIARWDGRGEPDPFTGRWGFPLADGIWCGLARGQYRADAGIIDLFGHVVGPRPAEWPFWRWMLRFRVLETLVHEAAHHHDTVARVARGRWRAEPGPRGEGYAERWQAEWTRTIVLPCLLQRYPEGFELLERLREMDGRTCEPSDLRGSG